jgi:hypothetical protein
MQMRNIRALRAAGSLAAALCAFGLAAAGCGGGGGDSAPPRVVTLADSIVTRPNPLTFAGGTAALKAQVTDPSGVDAASVKVDVKDALGASLPGMPVVMTPVAGEPDTYAASVTLPHNALGAAPAVYTVTVTAADLRGNTLGSGGVPGAILGTITVPIPPAPPGSP